MCRTDNRLPKETERQPSNYRSEGRERTKWRDEITTFFGTGWSTLTLDREVEDVGEGLMIKVMITLQLYLKY